MEEVDEEEEVEEEGVEEERSSLEFWEAMVVAQEHQEMRYCSLQEGVVAQKLEQG